MSVRILHISTRLILGGSQENTVLSCEGQARRGHEVHLAFGPIYGPEGSLLDRVQNFHTSDGRTISTHVIPHMVREVRPVSDRRAFSEIYRLVRSLQPDIVHTHSSKAGVLGRAAAWAARRDSPRTFGPPPVQPSSQALHGASGGFIAGSADPLGRHSRHLPAIVHTIHGPPFMPVEGSSFQQTKINLNNWLYTRAERFAAKRCHIIVSVADAMTREFLARGIGRPEQYITVRSGMEIQPFLNPAPGESREEVRTRLGLSPDDFVVGTVARLAEHKGHDDLLEALAERLRSHTRLKLLWVGDGWLRSRLVQRAKSMGLNVVEIDRAVSPSFLPTVSSSPHHILLTGLVGPEHIPGYIRAMDVLAHPSYREGLPRTVPQALLCGVCPVAYDADGTPEICRDMQTGRLVPTGDRTRLREAVVWLMTHPREREAMAHRGREECRIAFSAETMVDELEKVYVRALEIASH